jgi:2-aminoadipate transaminase
MNYESFLSAQGLRLRESAIRKMGAVLAQSGDLVSFAPGYPAEDLFPWEAFAEISGELMRSRDGKALQYGATRGYRPLLELIADLMHERGIATSADQLIVTSGSQQGLDLAATVLCDPGDVILVELPSYVGAISAFQNVGTELIGVPQDADGVNLDALTETLTRARRAGKRVKGFYTVPNFQNPTGLLVSQSKRRALLEWAAREDMLIIEDDPYGALYFEDVTTSADTRPIAAGDVEGRVIYLSSFSKTLAPGFRTAWINAPVPLVSRFELAKQSIDLCTGSFDQRMVAESIKRGVLAAQLPRLRAAYQAKRDVMSAALTSRLSSVLHWTPPRGGFFIWARLPEGLDAVQLLPVAQRHGVIYVTGDAFFVDGRGTEFIRLAFSAPSHARIEDGVRRLAEAVSEARSASAVPRAPLPAGR